jgi:RNA polymerase sigma-70 factor (ECF subfamily)
MYRVTANACLDLLRKRRPETGIEEFARVAVSPDGNPLADTVNKELGDQIKDAVRRLPEKYIPVIVLKDMEGLKYEEIAAALQISVGTVKSRISRGREKLRDILVSEGII